MIVRINETGRDNMAAGIDHFLAGDLLVGDDGDPVALDTNVRNGVVPGFRIHNPAVDDDQVVVFRSRRDSDGKDTDKQDCEPGDAGTIGQ